MNGTTLTQTQFALLSASILQCLPEGITLEGSDSWRGNHEELRARLAFLAQMAPEPKLKGKAKKPTLVNPVEFFVTSAKLYVDSSFTNRIDLSPCVDDVRELKVLFTLGSRKDDTAIAAQVGGKKMLKVTLPQFLRECRLAITGGRSIFVKGCYYLVYLEDTDGELSPVSVYWNGERLCLRCYRFDQDGGWSEGDWVCGN